MATQAPGVRSTRMAAVAALAALLAACDGAPSAIEDGDASVLAAVEQATVAEWHHLPAEEEVEARVQEAMTGTDDEDARWAVTWSAVLAAEAGVASGALGSGMAADGRLLVSRGAVALFGDRYAVDVLTGVQGALARIEATVQGRLPDERREALVRARAALQAAASAQGGDAAVSLAAALDAAESLRRLAPEHAAAEAIRIAAELLERAVAAAAGDPVYSEALAGAGAHLDAAEGHFASGAWARAMVEARHSAALSRRVIASVRAKQSERPGPTSQQAAERAIAVATDLYARAESKVAASGTPAQAQALAEARAHLALAVEAFDAREYPRAIREAVKSAEISRRILAASAAVDVTSALALRAIEAAIQLHIQAQAAVGSGGTQAQLDALARARALIDQAQAAHAAGNHVLALRLANEAGALCRRLIVGAG